MLHKGFKDVDAAEAELKLVLKACEYIDASTAGACSFSGMQDESSCALVRVRRHSHQKSHALVHCRPRNEGGSAGELCGSAFTHRQVGLCKLKMQAWGVTLFCLVPSRLC